MNRKSVLIFCPSVSLADKMAAMLNGEFIDANTPMEQRKYLIDAFRLGRIKYLCNVSVLTTGFDAPNVDCVCLCRSTMSPGLYYQMVGRGLRLCSGKSDCLILDFGHNILTHGPIDAIDVVRKIKKEKGKAPTIVCKNCGAVVMLSRYMVCAECGVQISEPQKMDMLETGGEILQGDGIWYDVTAIRYSVHEKIGGIPSMRVTYHCGIFDIFSEWICVEHNGFAKEKAIKWHSKRTVAKFIDNVEAEVAYGLNGAFANAKRIKVKKDGKYFRVVDYELDKIDESWCMQKSIKTVDETNSYV